MNKQFKTKIYKQDDSSKFDHPIVKIRGFHIIMCLLRCIYSGFHDSGVTEVLVEGIGSEGVITVAVKDGDVKKGIQFYKILYEAFVHTKVK